MIWSFSAAKTQFSEVIRRATRQGPQTISVRGQETAVLLSKADYDRLRSPGRPRDFKEWLLSGPSFDGVDLDRDQTPARDIEL